MKSKRSSLRASEPVDPLRHPEDNVSYVRGDNAKVSFVTVVFEEEISLLKLQARSISKFLDLSFVERIILVVNGRNQLAVFESITSKVLLEYGNAAHLVKVISGHDVEPGALNESGWHSQQALKLAISAFITTDYYVALDSKNHFIKPASRLSFFSQDGKALYSEQDFRVLMSEHYRNSMKLFGNDGAAHINSSLPTTTPFVFLTKAVREMREVLQTKGMVSFTEMVLHLPRTEFLAYYSYLLYRRSVDDLYVVGNSYVATLWRMHVEDPGLFADALRHAKNDSVFVFGVHRYARQAMTFSQKLLIADLWRSVGLVQEIEEGFNFLEDETTATPFGIWGGQHSTRRRLFAKRMLDFLTGIKPVRMNALAQVAIRNSKSSRVPVAVVIGPPWLRTGSGRVIQDQIAYYRDRGFSTAFVGVPVEPAHRPENPMWVEQAHAARDLHADHASFAILDAPQSPKTFWRRIRQSLIPRTSLDWIVEIGNCSRPPPTLLNYLRTRRVAILHVNHVFTLGFARRLRRELGHFGRGLPLLVETHDIQSQILCGRNEPNPWTGHPDDLDLLLGAEKALLKHADVLVHCSVDDHRFFSQQFPKKPQMLALPLMDRAFVAAISEAQEIAPIDILFVGTGNYPNAEAVEWFLTEVWPLIASKRYTVRIIGTIDVVVRQRRPDLYNQFYDLFLGRVTDLAAYYRAARSVIAPMRSGGGISVKTIEAFALGMPFIGTAKAYRGFPPEALARHGIQSHDDPHAFAEALFRALSGSDDTRKRGRGLYEELFSKQTCYAARDDATRLARNIHSRVRNERDATVKRISTNEAGNSRGSKVDVDVLVLGTSSCIGPTSFVEKIHTEIDVKLINLSIGACSSTLGLYQLHKVYPVQRGIALIDFAINDPNVGWHLWGAQNAPHIIEETLKTIVARLRSMNFLPILVLLGDAHDPFGNAMHRDICMRERVNFIDLRAQIIAAMQRGASRNSLMNKDDCHISVGAAEEVAILLAAIIRRMNATSVKSVPLSASVLQERVVYACELFPRQALIDRGSSLRSAFHGRLAIGDSVHIPMANDERLRGVMINVGAKGGTIALRGSKAEITKSMTAYWDAQHPEWFGSFLIDFAHPLPGGPGGLVMQMVGPDAVPTEPTIYSKPTLPGRYGELEIEGVLLTRCDETQYNFSGPAYGWMPLDLGELPEARQLVDRLTRLQCAGTPASGRLQSRHVR